VTSSSESNDPLAVYNELRLAGQVPNLDEFCGRYPYHPTLRERIQVLAQLQQDLQKLVGVSEVAPEPPPITVTGFQILRRLGAGGMGTVYLAEQQHPRRLCALKLMRHPTPNARKRFAREADLAARLTHPNVAAVYVFGLQDDVAYLATEYVHGFSLRALLQVADVVQPSGGMDWIVEALRHLSEGLRPQSRASMPGPVPAMLRMATAIADALGAAHEHGVIHRDTKPSNIMVTFDGTPKVIDFGIAVADDAPDARFTQVGSFVGSWDYAAPEQLRGEVDAIGPWSDTYALGATLFEMLTLRTPFECASYADRLSRAGEPPPHGPRFYNPAVPSSIDALVRQTMDPDPSRRFQDGRELAEAMEAAARQPRLLPRLSGRLAPLALLTRVHLALAVAIILAIVLAILYANQRTERLALDQSTGRDLRRSALEVLSWQLDHTKPALERCLPQDKRANGPLSPRIAPRIPPYLAAQLVVSRGNVVEVTLRSALGLNARTERCLIDELKEMELPGVGMTGAMTLPVNLRLVGNAPLEHTP
jgi:serine/threonine protein kinase